MRLFSKHARASCKQRDEFEEVEALSGLGIRKIACGHWHSAAASVDGTVYTWGWDERLQLGVRWARGDGMRGSSSGCVGHVGDERLQLGVRWARGDGMRGFSSGCVP
jgi:alpha-tubulin suppressor-like RCC1 family protein